MAEFFKVFNMRGFDRHRSPRWQMVPVGGDRYIQLRDGAGLAVSSSNPAAVSVTEIKAAELPSSGEREIVPAGARLFKLHGGTKDTASILAKNSTGATVIELETNATEKKDVYVTFNFVKDNAGHKTRRVPASVAQWLQTVNYIYKGQANIVVHRHDARWVTVKQNLGTSINRTAGADDERVVVEALGDSTANLNFFMVWDYQTYTKPGVDVDASRIGDNILFEDRAGSQVGETIAHEIGHWLGVDDKEDDTVKHHLMYAYTDVRGIHLPKEDVNTMNA